MIDLINNLQKAPPFDIKKVWAGNAQETKHWKTIAVPGIYIIKLFDEVTVGKYHINMFLIVALFAGVGRIALAQEMSSQHVSDKATRDKIVRQLKARGSAAVPDMIKILDNTDVDIIMKQEIMRILGDLRDKQAIKPLMKYANDKNTALKISSLVALANIGDKEASSTFVVALKDKDREVRWRAAGFAKTMCGKEAKEALIEVALNDPYYEARIRALNSLLYIAKNVFSEGISNDPTWDKGISKIKQQEIQKKVGRNIFFPVKVLLGQDYKFNCEYIGDIKRFEAICFSNKNYHDEQIIPFLLEALKAHTKLSFEIRKKMESSHWKGEGDGFLTALASSIISYKGSAVRLVEKEITQANGDYRYELVIILYKISLEQDLNGKMEEYYPVYQFKTEYLPFCAEGLRRSESNAIRYGLAEILQKYDYYPGVDLKKMTEEILKPKNSIIKD